MCWAEFSCSDYSDPDADSAQPVEKPSYLDAVHRGSLVRVDLDLVGVSTQPATQTVEELPVEASTGEARTTQKRHRRRSRTRRFASASREPSAAAHVPADQRLEPRADGDRRHGEGCVSMHQRLGPQAPPRWQHRISDPDYEGWREVLPRQPAEQRPPPPRNPPRRRHIPAALYDRCLNYLSYNHRLATCCAPLRCLRCHGLRHLARDCKRGRHRAPRRTAMAR